MRNSSLVKWFCADNVAGLKRTAEAVAATRGAGAFYWLLVCVGLGAPVIVGKRVNRGDADR